MQKFLSTCLRVWKTLLEVELEPRKSICYGSVWEWRAHFLLKFLITVEVTKQVNITCDLNKLSLK